MEKQKLPNATVVLILGILSIPGCCFYCIGLVFGIVALVLAKKDTALYAANPDGYDNFGNIKTGKTLAIIGIVLNSIAIVMTIAIIVAFGSAALGDPEAMKQAIEQMFGK